MRRRFKHLWVGMRLGQDLLHGRDEGIKRLLRLGLSRFDQQTFGYQHREVGGWGMVTLV